MDEKDLRRNQVRAQISETNISGLMAKAKSENFVPFVVWDVTPTGMGILTPEKLKQNMEIEFTVGNPYVLRLKGVVIWCHQEEKQDQFRAGIKVIDGQSKLESLYYSVCNDDAKDDDKAS